MIGFFNWELIAPVCWGIGIKTRTHEMHKGAAPKIKSLFNPERFGFIVIMDAESASITANPAFEREVNRGILQQSFCDSWSDRFH